MLYSLPALKGQLSKPTARTKAPSPFLPNTFLDRCLTLVPSATFILRRFRDFSLVIVELNISLPSRQGIFYDYRVKEEKGNSYRPTVKSLRRRF